MSNPRIDPYWRIVRDVEFQDDGCWLWTSWTDKGGYGQSWRYTEAGERRHVLAHRASFELFRGPIPEGLDLDHLCRVRACVNPWHLEPVTNLENLMRSPLTAIHPREICKRGHPMEEPNLVWNSRGGRACRECNLANQRRWRADASARR